MKKLAINIILFATIILFFISCKVQQKRAVVVKSIQPVEEAEVKYPCGFKISTFEGKLPCFGNDCMEVGVTLTTLKFEKDYKLIKVLEAESGQQQTIQATWNLTDNCILEISYADGKQEFFKYHHEKNRIELLNAQQESYKGMLYEKCFISRIN